MLCRTVREILLPDSSLLRIESSVYFKTGKDFWNTGEIQKQAGSDQSAGKLARVPYKYY